MTLALGSWGPSLSCLRGPSKHHPNYSWVGSLPIYTCQLLLLSPPYQQDSFIYFQTPPSKTKELAKTSSMTITKLACA